MNTSNINAKVFTATVAGAATSLGVWALAQFGHIALPPEQAASLTVIVSAIIGYLTPHSTGATPSG